MEGLSLLFYFSVLGIKPRALHMLGKRSATELHPRPPEGLSKAYENRLSGLI